MHARTLPYSQIDRDGDDSDGDNDENERKGEVQEAHPAEFRRFGSRFSERIREFRGLVAPEPKMVALYKCAACQFSCVQFPRENTGALPRWQATVASSRMSYIFHELSYVVIMQTVMLP